MTTDLTQAELERWYDDYVKACRSQGLPDTCPIETFVRHHRGNALITGTMHGWMVYGKELLKWKAIAAACRAVQGPIEDPDEFHDGEEWP